MTLLRRLQPHPDRIPTPMDCWERSVRRAKVALSNVSVDRLNTSDWDHDKYLRRKGNAISATIPLLKLLAKLNSKWHDPSSGRGVTLGDFFGWSSDINEL